MKQIYETNLHALNIAFQKDNKWKFNDGNNMFFAEVKDKEFIEEVQRNNIRFAKNDILKVKIHYIQTLVNNKIKTEHIITKVLKHYTYPSEIELPNK